MLRFLLPALALAVAYYVWRSPDGWAGLARLLRPLLYLALALLYVRSPIDLIPDATAIGFIDDLLVMLAAIYFGRPVRRGNGTMGDAAGTAAGGDEARNKGGSGATRKGAARDPHEVLGVAPGASREEITRAFREQMKLYHPDRVAGLGEDLQKVAHEKSVEIQRAYDALRHH